MVKPNIRGAKNILNFANGKELEKLRWGGDGTGRLLYSMVFMLDGISDISVHVKSHLSY